MTKDLFYIFTDEMSGEERYRSWKKEYIRAGLILCDWNKSKAARFLGISLKTLRNWMDDHPEVEEFKGYRFGYSKAIEEVVDFNGCQTKTYRVKDYAKKKIERIAQQFWFRQLSEEEREKVKTRILEQY